jgi:CheY-like chemotaxis protein
MWEKIVFNLLSNALKFTLQGKIAVTLSKQNHHVEFTVQDTGVGIPISEQTRIFERFHRVETVHGRSYEGSGIGLVLVSELVKSHIGSIQLESTLGKGSTFTVCLPLGKEHLPAENIGHRDAYKLGNIGRACVEEALGWLPEGSLHMPLRAISAPSNNHLYLTLQETSTKPCIIIADDNADMRQYIRNILTPYWNVEAAENGKRALELIHRHKPDLILTDIMMPKMDGFQLLHEIRAHPKTQLIPVIMLSARASDEARVDGIQAGADDYLVKPFCAKELIARVNTHLELGRLRLRLEEQVKHRTVELEKTH